MAHRSYTPQLFSQAPCHNNLEQDSSFLKLASINKNSLFALARRTDSINFAIENDLDISILCKTHLSAKMRLQSPIYDFIRTDRSGGRGGGGTGILIKRIIPFTRLYSPSSRNNGIIEYTIIKIELGRRNLFLVALYANNEANASFLVKLETLFNKLELHSINNYYIIAGDFNARHKSWGDMVSNTKGNLLKRWLENEGLGYRVRIVPPVQPTFP